jgi:hypothetical protein
LQHSSISVRNMTVKSGAISYLLISQSSLFSAYLFVPIC